MLFFGQKGACLTGDYGTQHKAIQPLGTYQWLVRLCFFSHFSKALHSLLAFLFDESSSIQKCVLVAVVEVVFFPILGFSLSAFCSTNKKSCTCRIEPMLRVTWQRHARCLVRGWRLKVGERGSCATRVWHWRTQSTQEVTTAGFHFANLKHEDERSLNNKIIEGLYLAVLSSAIPFYLGFCTLPRHRPPRLLVSFLSLLSLPPAADPAIHPVVF